MSPAPEAIKSSPAESLPMCVICGTFARSTRTSRTPPSGFGSSDQSVPEQ
jgi:hypothetical protein